MLLCLGFGGAAFLVLSGLAILVSALKVGEEYCRQCKHCREKVLQSADPLI